MKKKIIAIFLILLSIGIGLGSLSILFQERKEEINDMENNNYEYLRDVQNNKYPFNAHLRIEVSDADIYFVDASNQKVLLKTANEGETVTIITTRTRNIQALWYDRTAERIYFVDCDQSDTQFTVWYLVLSTDTPTAMGTYSATSVSAYDIIYSTTDTAWYILGAEDVSGTVKFAMYKWSGSVWNLRDTESAFTSVSYMIPEIVFPGGTYLACVAKLTGGNVHIFVWDDSIPAFYSAKDLGSNTDLPSLWNQRGLSYDGDFLYFLIKDTADSNKIKLWTYDVTNSIATKYGEYNISLMMDRSTASGIKEKGFHLTDYKIYQIHTNAHQLYNIAQPNLSGVIKAITDNYFFAFDESSNVEIWKYVDVNSKVFLMDFNHNIQNYPEGRIQVVKDSINIAKGMFIQIEGKYTSAGSTTTDVISEGFVKNFDDKKLQNVFIESPAKNELLKIFPRGDFSGRSDQIISSLLSTYCKYITEGTLETGTAMGTVTFAGDKTLLTILNDLAKFENWIWYLTPQGQLYFNAGTVDSGVDLSETSKTVWNVHTDSIREPYNYFFIKGAIAAGAQFYKELEEADDLKSQQEYGYNPLSETYSELNSQSLVDTMATNRKARMQKSPLLVRHDHYDSTKGFIQPGETVTFQFLKSEPNIISDQFLINRVKFNAREGIGRYMIADELI